MLRLYDSTRSYVAGDSRANLKLRVSHAACHMSQEGGPCILRCDCNVSHPCVTNLAQGVWLSIVQKDGRNKFKRIRFSQQRFPNDASWQVRDSIFPGVRWQKSEVYTGMQPAMMSYRRLLAGERLWRGRGLMMCVDVTFTLRPCTA